jgi:hypothetical protein
MKNPFKNVNLMINQAARILRRKGRLGGATFTWQDVGDIYHVYGVNASGKHLAALIINRGQRKGER